MENLINELITTIKNQYKSWEVIRTKYGPFTALQNFRDAEKIDQIQKYYLWFTEDSFDRLSNIFQEINSSEIIIQKLLKSSHILNDLYECFCNFNEPPNTLYWDGIEELFITYCKEVLGKEVK
jgi:hypothetical protein